MIQRIMTAGVVSLALLVVADADLGAVDLRAADRDDLGAGRRTVAEKRHVALDAVDRDRLRARTSVPSRFTNAQVSPSGS